MKVTIEEWNAVASWRWDMPEDDVCGICRVQFDGTCPTCKYPGDDCTLCRSRFFSLFAAFYGRNIEKLMMIVIGKCGHSFHMVDMKLSFDVRETKRGQHCLLTWIQQDSSKGLCPMCRQSESSHSVVGVDCSLTLV